MSVKITLFSVSEDYFIFSEVIRTEDYTVNVSASEDYFIFSEVIVLIKWIHLGEAVS